MVKRYSAKNTADWLSDPLLKTAAALASDHLAAEGKEIAEILYELGLDTEGLACAVMYPSIKAQEIHLDTVIDHFGENSAKLLRDVLQMGSLGKLQHLDGRKPHQLENLRKMLLAMVADVRAILITLAERLWLLRHDADEEFARQTLEIYTPLANRLGVSALKWEMEDLCLRYLKPDVYKKIAVWLASRRAEREIYIQQAVSQLKQLLTQAGIHKFEVMGRVKHIYSIYKKMQRKNGNLEDIYDISAVRVLVQNIADCYAALGVVHEKWTQIPKEFDDYIAHPKPNGYQSIHTAVVGPEDRTVEVQIRTYAIHKASELGVAAHWRYKEGGVQQSEYEAKIAWLRQVMEWQKEVMQNNKKNSLQTQMPVKDLFAERVYVFTPAGDIIDLPQGATPLDFAYYIHGEVGHRCRGAKIDGSIVPLTYQLQMGERVEILTAKQPSPSRDWLSPHTGCLKTARARAKVMHWFKALDETASQQKAVKHKSEAEKPALPLPANFIAKKNIEKSKSHKARSLQDVQILGLGHLLTQIARCCKPLPGEKIIGYITQGKGVSIHRQSCKNIVHVRENARNRIIEVDWGEKTANIYPVDLKIEAYDRQGLLRDFTAYFALEKLNVLNIQTYTNKVSQAAHIHLTIEISSLSNLQHILNGLRKIPNVIAVWRDQ